MEVYCVAARLVVELDGPVHDGQSELDGARDRALAAIGTRTLRFRNEEVTDDIEAVLRRILDVLQSGFHGYGLSLPPSDASLTCSLLAPRGA